MNNEKTIKDIIEHTLNWMNNQRIYREDYNDIISGSIQKIIERRIIERFKFLWPYLNIYHPSDKSGKPDLFTDVYNKGIEIKTTFGWPTYKYKKDGTKIKTSNDGNVTWTNSTTQETDEYFLFIKLSLNDNKLYADRIYFGKLSYKDWKIKPKSGAMYIKETTVKNLCNQLK